MLIVQHTWRPAGRVALLPWLHTGPTNMQPTNARDRRRDQLIKNILATAAVHGKPLHLASALDTPIRVYHPDTDQPCYVPMRAVTASTVRCP